jgi:hypothetical protein
MSGMHIKNQQGSTLRKARKAWFSLISAPLAAILLVSCGGSKPSSLVSPFSPGNSGREASSNISGGMQKLMDSISKPAAPFHLAYTAQENINSNFPQQEGSKLEVGQVEVSADVSADQIAVTNSTGSKKTDNKAAKSDPMAWAMAQADIMMPLLGANFSLAFGGIAARPAGSDNVGSIAADKYEMDTSSTSATNKMAFEAVSGMLGGKIKIESVKGNVWIERSSGRMVKFNIDTGLSDKAGNSWKEHHELVVTPQ